jgi:hypothetical protein
MVRKISFLIISIGILFVGYIAFTNLSYWERSIRIFKYDPDLAIEGRGGRGGFEGRGNLRGREGFRPDVSGRGFERPQSGEVPDSLMRIFQERRERSVGRRGNVTDSLRREFGGNRFERPGSNLEVRDGERRGRSGFPAGRKINLRNVYWFLAVFAAFTVVVIYVDKVLYLIKKKSNTNSARPLNKVV